MPVAPSSPRAHPTSYSPGAPTSRSATTRGRSTTPAVDAYWPRSTGSFTTLVLAQLFNCFNARSDRASAFHRLFTNPLLWGAIALSAVLQVAVVYVPFFNDAFETAPLGITDWLLCTAMASMVLWADEVRKLVYRRRAGRVLTKGEVAGFRHEAPAA